MACGPLGGTAACDIVMGVMDPLVRIIWYEETGACIIRPCAGICCGAVGVAAQHTHVSKQRVQPVSITHMKAAVLPKKRKHESKRNNDFVQWSSRRTGRLARLSDRAAGRCTCELVPVACPFSFSHIFLCIAPTLSM